ncbi:MAG: hypothetical protein PVS3B1_03730 [Ktedonobacteraceae bacterium]
MSIFKSVQPSRAKLSLTIRVSVILVLAVVIPLLITVVGSELILRPTLLAQAAGDMGNDAQSHSQAVDSLLTARVQNVGSIGRFLAIQRFLAGDDAFKQQALNELALGDRLDPNYSNWSLFDTKGNARLAYPIMPAPRGKYMIPPDILRRLNDAHKTLISDVYFDDQTHAAFIDIYTSIIGPNATPLGIGRSTLKLNEIWTAVNNETNAAHGSYAMILDGHGVRIAYTNTDNTATTLPQALFKPISPISPELQQRIRDENLYGNSRAAVRVLPDPDLANMQNDPRGPATFQFTPTLQQEAFQAYRATSKVVPWTYIVLRPVNTITGVANQQDLYLFLLAAFVILLAAIVGILVGRSITRPILSAVSSLLINSQMLKTLANREKVMATEQMWIVESSQNGLKSVRYYAEATNVAARRLDSIGKELAQNLERLNAQHRQQLLHEIQATANYIEKAATHQERSSKGLTTAIQVTNQVTEQLASNATSTTDAATQLEEVIERLRQVVGR